MELSHIIATLLIGAISGWLAGWFRQGAGFGLLGNIIVGIIGSFVGAFIFKSLDISVGTGLCKVIFRSVVGALVFLFLLGLIQGGGRTKRR